MYAFIHLVILHFLFSFPDVKPNFESSNPSPQSRLKKKKRNQRKKPYSIMKHGILIWSDNRQWGVMRVLSVVWCAQETVAICICWNVSDLPDMSNQTVNMSNYRVFKNPVSHGSKHGRLSLFHTSRITFLAMTIPYWIDRALQWLKVSSCSDQPRITV